MANNFDPRIDPRLAPFGAQVQADAGFDAGLRSYMLGIYNYMASGVLLTGIVAMLVFSSPALRAVFFNEAGGPTLLGWGAIISPFIMVLVMSFGANRLSETALKGIFWGYAALMGVSLSTLFAVYTGESIARVFFITAAMFGALSLYGYTTKRDLSAWGRFLFMGVIGIIIASIANIFFQSSSLGLATSIITVLVFAGLTAYDTQKLQNMYGQLQGTAFIGKASVLGALELYLDFINMFLAMLRLFGNRD
jgi:FtsH-binding integral membrane protein